MPALPISGLPAATLPLGATDALAVVQGGTTKQAPKSAFAGGSGGLVLLEQHAASASASLDFTTWYSSTYDEYLIEVISIIPAGNTDLKFRMSTNGGSSYAAGASDYGWTAGYTLASGAGALGATNADGIAWRGQNTTLGTGGSFNGTLNLFNPGSAAIYKTMSGLANILDNSGGMIGLHLHGIYKNTAAVNAFQLLAASGNLTSGTVRCYGIVKV